MDIQQAEVLYRISRTAPRVQLNVWASKGCSWAVDRRDVSSNERRPLNRTIGTTVTWIISPVLVLP
ncbi:hypothetical protein J6590_073921 [Homalodisca vitripennis]|nr:hypothetical protein J6590_073921 [Homalodisca vitripennis]